MGTPLIEAKNLADLGVSHGFFTRQGGVSWGREDLNCGLGADDRPEDVAENRDRVRRAVGAEKLVSVWQHHSADIVTLDNMPDWERGPKADGLVTTVPGLAISALSADCGALLAIDESAGVIGAAHSGWKGTSLNIAASLVEAMTAKGAKASNLTVALGPMIRQRSYEVGPEFPDLFAEVVEDHGRFFTASPKDGHFLGDIAGIIEAQVKALGVKSFVDTGEDTYSDEERFFSARRGAHRKEPDYGRLISCIVLPTD